MLLSMSFRSVNMRMEGEGMGDASSGERPNFNYKKKNNISLTLVKK